MRRPIVRLTIVGLLVQLLVAPNARADRLALRDGTTLDGATSVDETTQTILIQSTRGGVQFKDRISFSRALAVETPDQRLSWLSAEAEVVEASRVLWTATERGRYLEWTDRALMAGDRMRADRFLDGAMLRGVSGFPITSRRSRIALLRDGGGIDSVGKTLDAEEAGLPSARASLLWSRVALQFPSISEATRVERATTVLAIDPGNAAAIAYRDSLIPEEHRSRFSWKQWAPWWRVLGPGATLQFPPKSGTSAGAMNSVQRELARAATLWNPDVVGLIREGLVVVTCSPPGPGVERVSATTSAVVAYLEDLFRTDTPNYKLAEPAIVWAFRDRDDLWAHLSTHELQSDEIAFRETNGKKLERLAFYLPSVGLTKVLSPDDSGGLENERALSWEVAYTTIRHWQFVRCPRFRLDELAITAELPGYWAFREFEASLAMGDIDPRSGRWVRAQDSRPKDKALLKRRMAGNAIAWADVLDGTYAEFKELELAKSRSVVATERLYAWSAGARLAVEYMLYEAEPAMRRRFADHLTAYCRGDSRRLKSSAAYGLEPEELGRRVDEWASK